MKGKILLVEDNESIMEINTEALQMEGFTVFAANTLKSAKEIISNEIPDIIILDIMLPDGSGIDFLSEIRQNSTVPVIFLTCLDTKQNIVECLKSGGDDYLTKPYHIDELVIRIEALLRRIEIEHKKSEKEIKFGSLIINTLKMQVICGSENIFITPKEFALLIFLIHNENKLFTAEELYLSVWNDNNANDVRTVRVHIASLRKKLKIDEGFAGFDIQTNHRKYYVLTRD